MLTLPKVFSRTHNLRFLCTAYPHRCLNPCSCFRKGGFCFIYLGWVFHLTSPFLLDLIASLPLEICLLIPPLIGSPSLLRYLYLFRLNRILRVHRTGEYFAAFTRTVRQLHSRFFTGTSAVVRIVQMVCALLVFYHVTACCWYGIDRLEQGADYHMSWTKADNLEDSTRGERYLRTLYFGLITSLSVGYGAIVPVTQIETLFVVFYAWVGTAMYLALLATLTLVVETLHVDSSEFEEKLTRFRHLMDYRDLHPVIRDQVLAYYHYLWFLQRGHSNKSVIDLLPEHLRQLLVCSFTESALKRTTLLCNASTEFFKHLSLHLHPLTLANGDVLLREREVVHSTYLVQHGSISTKKGVDKVTRYRRGDYIAGEVRYGVLPGSLPRQRTPRNTRTVHI